MLRSLVLPMTPAVLKNVNKDTMASIRYTWVDKKDSPDSTTCCICLDIFYKPVRIPCGHAYCDSCVKPLTMVAEPQCPQCRQTFNPKKVIKDTALKKLLLTTKRQCIKCKKQISLYKLRNHACMRVDISSLPKFEPIAETSQSPPKDVPNRSTFSCPYCGVKNLDTQALVHHCNHQHGSSSAKVVCPICAVMPWGDPTRKSIAFLQHLNHRHQFEYDTFVDFEQDDETMMQAAIAASLQT